MTKECMQILISHSTWDMKSWKKFYRGYNWSAEFVGLVSDMLFLFLDYALFSAQSHFSI